MQLLANTQLSFEWSQPLKKTVSDVCKVCWGALYHSRVGYCSLVITDSLSVRQDEELFQLTISCLLQHALFMETVLSPSLRQRASNGMRGMWSVGAEGSWPEVKGSHLSLVCPLIPIWHQRVKCWACMAAESSTGLTGLSDCCYLVLLLINTDCMLY